MTNGQRYLLILFCVLFYTKTAGLGINTDGLSWVFVWAPLVPFAMPTLALCVALAVIAGIALTLRVVRLWERISTST